MKNIPTTFRKSHENCEWYLQLKEFSIHICVINLKHDMIVLLNSCHCLSVVYDFKSALSNLCDEWTFCAEYHVCHFRLLECPYQVLHDGRPFKSVDKGEITTKKIVDCLRTKPMEQMMNTHPNFYEWKHLEQSQVIFPLSSKYLDFSK